MRKHWRFRHRTVEVSDLPSTHHILCATLWLRLRGYDYSDGECIVLGKKMLVFFINRLLLLVDATYILALRLTPIRLALVLFPVCSVKSLSMWVLNQIFFLFFSFDSHRGAHGCQTLKSSQLGHINNSNQRDIWYLMRVQRLKVSVVLLMQRKSWTFFHISYLLVNG